MRRRTFNSGNIAFVNSSHHAPLHGRYSRTGWQQHNGTHVRTTAKRMHGRRAGVTRCGCMRACACRRRSYPTDKPHVITPTLRHKILHQLAKHQQRIVFEGVCRPVEHFGHVCTVDQVMHANHVRMAKVDDYSAD
jgi:hypothetical protein